MLTKRFGLFLGKYGMNPDGNLVEFWFKFSKVLNLMHSSCIKKIFIDNKKLFTIKFYFKKRNFQKYFRGLGA